MAVTDSTAQALAYNGVKYFHDESKKFDNYPYRDALNAGALYSYLAARYPNFVMTLGGAINEAGLDGDRVEAAMRDAANRAQGDISLQGLTNIMDALASEASSFFRVQFWRELLLADAEKITNLASEVASAGMKALWIYGGIAVALFAAPMILKTISAARKMRVATNPKRNRKVKAELQSIVVKRKKGMTAKDAREIAAKAGARTLSKVDKTSTSYRFRQKPPKFKKYRSKPIAKLGATQIYGISNPKITMDLDDLIKEHQELVRALRGTKDKDLKNQYKRQLNELAELYNRKTKNGGA